MRFGGDSRGYGFFNRKLYEEFAKDMRERLNPKKAYGDQEENDGLHSTAKQREEEVAATMVVLKGQTKEAEDIGKKQKRHLVDVKVKPLFHHETGEHHENLPPRASHERQGIIKPVAFA